MVIASGNSRQHVRSIANNITQTVKAAGHRVHGVEGLEQGEWVLIDLGDCVVHVMIPETREYYELEKLWNLDLLGENAS